MMRGMFIRATASERRLRWTTPAARPIPPNTRILPRGGDLREPSAVVGAHETMHPAPPPCLIGDRHAAAASHDRPVVAARQRSAPGSPVHAPPDRARA